MTATQQSTRSVPPVTVAVAQTGPVTVRIAAIGELDARSIGWLSEQTIEALDLHRPAAIELDLTGVDFIDGAAAAQLRRLHRHAADRGCELSVCAAQQGTWWTFNVAGLNSIFPAPAKYRFQSEPGS